MFFYIYFFYLFCPIVNPAGFLRTPFLFPLSLPPHFAKLPTAGASADDLLLATTLHRICLGHGETAENPCRCRRPYIFSDHSMPAIKESEELASHSIADVQVSARLSGHPSKYWLRAAQLDFRDRRGRAPTAHLPLSVIRFLYFCSWSNSNL